MNVDRFVRPAARLAAIVGLALAPAAHGQAPDGDEGAPGWTALFRDVRFSLGGLRWGADVTTELRMQRFADQPAQRGFLESGNVAMSAYVHQPWLAQIAANLGFVATQGRGAAEDSAALFGGATLSVFPMSRFPFEAIVNLSDSRASGESAGADFRSLSAGLRQAYRPSNDTAFAARLDRSVVSGAAIGRDTLEAAAATFSGRRGAHRLDAEAFASANSGGAGAVDTSIRRVNATHAYTPAENLSVDTLASWNWQESSSRTGGLSGALAGRFAQLASYATWRPDEDHPLYDEKRRLLATAGVRLASVGFDAGDGVRDALTVGGSAGVSYTLDPRTRVDAAGSMTWARGDGRGDELATAFNVSLAYDPPPIPWQGNTYSWRAAAGAVSASGAGLDRHGLTAQASHQLTREIALPGPSQVGLTFGQGLAAGASTRSDNAVAVTHSAQATWTLAGGAASHTYASLALVDSRTFGTPETGFQLLNLQLTRQAPVNALSHWTANLTVQGSRQRAQPSATTTTTAFDTGFNTSVFGSLSYQHRRVFGVPRLRFIASYTASGSQVDARAEGDVTAAPRQAGDTFDARLEYRIGKLEARLVVRSASIDGRRGEGIYLRATRVF